jgi:hypothetical protein
MHASTALAKLKKEEKRAMKEGRPVSGAASGGEDDEPETPAEVQTVMERKASVTVSGSTHALAESKSFPLTVVVFSLCLQIGETKKGRGAQRGSSRKQMGDEDGTEEEPPKSAPVVAAPPSFNPLAASGYELSRSDTGSSGQRPGVPLEVDSHMLLDEETEFQLSRLETQQDDLEDWSRSLQHQLPTIKGV